MTREDRSLPVITNRFFITNQNGLTSGYVLVIWLLILARCLARRRHRDTVANANCTKRFHRHERYARTSALAGRLGTMGLNPFTYDRDASCRDESTEFGFGPGMFPDPNIDFSAGGSKSLIPIADPTSDAQLLELAMIKRTDVTDPSDFPSPYVEGNTDRYGAAPPLVREKRVPPNYPRPRYTRPTMQREW